MHGGSIGNTVSKADASGRQGMSIGIHAVDVPSKQALVGIMLRADLSRLGLAGVMSMVGIRAHQQPDASGFCCTAAGAAAVGWGGHSDKTDRRVEGDPGPFPETL